MAKQVGPVFFTGTIDGLIFYKLGDKYYTRSKGSYKSGKHMRKDPHYKRTMQQADRFGGAVKLVQDVYYRHLPKAVRKHGLFGKLTGLVNKWLYAGKSKEEVQELLLAHCKSLAAAATTPKEITALPAQPKQRKASNEQRLTNVEQRPTTNAQRHVKQPRYLSRWKVKRNGRLHIPKPLRGSSTGGVDLKTAEAQRISNKEQGMMNEEGIRDWGMFNVQGTRYKKGERWSNECEKYDISDSKYPIPNLKMLNRRTVAEGCDARDGEGCTTADLLILLFLFPWFRLLLCHAADI